MSIDVLHVVPAFYPTRGGIEVLVENLTQALNHSSGLVHGVLSPRVDFERPDDLVLGNTRVWSVDAPHPESLRQYHEGIEAIPQESIEFGRVLRATRRHLRTIKPKIIHLHGFSLVGSAVAAIAEAWNIPLIMHVHGSVEGGLSLRMRRQLTHSTFVIAVSQFVAASIDRETQRTEGVVIVRNGLPDAYEFVAGETTCPEPDSVVLIGRLEPTKGFDVALRGLAALRKDFPRIAIHIVGVGIERENLELQARELGLASSVTFHGRLDRVDVLRRIRGSTCVLVPSIALEGFSLVALESALLERPVVASDVGGLPETVADGVTGTIVDPCASDQITEAVRRYFVLPDLAAVHGRAGRERALREFTLGRSVAQVEAIHSEVLKILLRRE